jgi:hypothetical protein
MNKQDMDKEAIINVFKDYTRLMEKQKIIAEAHNNREKAPAELVRKVANIRKPKQKKSSLKKLQIGEHHLPLAQLLKQVKGEDVRKVRFPLKADQQDIDNLVETIRKRSGLNIVTDVNAIREGVRNGTVRTRITLKVDNMTFENALNWITRLAGLKWTIEDEAIFITTPDRLKKKTKKMRIYDIRDMMVPIQDFPAPKIAFGKDGDGLGDGWGF